MKLTQHCLAFTLLLLSPSIQGQMSGSGVSPTSFAAGVDISELGALQANGAIYRERGTAMSPYVIFRNEGVNWMRIRLFVNPSGVGPLTNDLPYTIALARKIKSNGFHLLLDIHYSDGWADPHQQHTPKAWAAYDHTQLVAEVRHYTREAVQCLMAAGAPADMVEVGNEITNGMMWNDGRVSPQSQDEVQWSHLTDLLKAGIEGVHDASIDSPRIMIHIDRGGDITSSKQFYDHILARGVRFDVIGLSDYPWWQGTLGQLKQNLASLATAYHKPIFVVETGFPWAPQSIGVDGRNYNAQQTESEVLHFPATPAGQAEYIAQLVKTVQQTPEGLGAGIFYWAAAWIPNQKWNPPPWSHDWEERALFDKDGNALPALHVLGSSSHEVLTPTLAERTPPYDTDIR